MLAKQFRSITLHLQPDTILVIVSNQAQMLEALLGTANDKTQIEALDCILEWDQLPFPLQLFQLEENGDPISEIPTFYTAEYDGKVLMFKGVVRLYKIGTNTNQAA